MSSALRQLLILLCHLSSPNLCPRLMEHSITKPIISSLHCPPAPSPAHKASQDSQSRDQSPLPHWPGSMAYALHQPCLPFGARCVPSRKCLPIFELLFPPLESRHHNPKHPAAHEALSQVYTALTSPSLSSSKDKQIPKILIHNKPFLL
jgi:hypothetical protein